MDAGAKRLGEVMREEAADRAPDVVYVDTYELFSTDSGEYSRYILDEHGEEITARIGDGVHFAEGGAQYLARALFLLLDTRWSLSDRADYDNPIGWTLADGSGESVPGYASRPRSRYQSEYSGSPVTNAPPTSIYIAPPSTIPAPVTTAITAPPVTAPPPTSPPQTTPPTSPPTTTQ
jgi:hypothetical protein